MTEKDFNKLRQGVRFGNFFTSYGRVEQIVGMTIEASGMSCNVGDVCIIYTNDGQEVECEAVGFRGALALLMPYNDTDGVGYGNPVFNTHKKLQVKMSDALIGRTVDALGNPIDGKGEIKGNSYYSINGKPSKSKTIGYGMKNITFSSDCVLPILFFIFSNSFSSLIGFF